MRPELLLDSSTLSARRIAQEALVGAQRHVARLPGARGTVSTCVLTISRNLAVDTLWKRRAVPTDPYDLAELRLGSSGDRDIS